MQKRPGLDIFSYSDKKLSSYINGLTEVNLDASYYLLLLVGPFRAGKENVLSRLQNKLGTFREIDTRELISLDEQASFKKIDEAFEAIAPDEKNLVFRNGDVLAGEYTGFTYSAVRYATPQEKYLLKKIAASEKFFVIDIREFENVDMTLRRYAQAAIRFEPPSSFPANLFWKLRQIRVHGHTFANKRPANA